MKSFLWQAKPWQAFKTFAIIFSFTINLVTLLILFLIAPLILPIVNDIAKPIVGGLSDSFAEMGEANIVRIIPVDDTIPVVFTLPLQTDTEVILTDAVPLAVNARFMLPGGGGTINGTVNIELPKGLSLPVALDLQVPVSQTVPVNLDVAVNIPLNETDLGVPFDRLQMLFGPLDVFLDGLPEDSEQARQRIQQGLTGASQTTTEPTDAEVAND
jgi:hypothetical protein